MASFANDSPLVPNEGASAGTTHAHVVSVLMGTIFRPIVISKCE